MVDALDTFVPRLKLPVTPVTLPPVPATASKPLYTMPLADEIPVLSAKLPATFATVPLPPTLVALMKVMPRLVLPTSSKPAAPVIVAASAAMKPVKLIPLEVPMLAPTSANGDPPIPVIDPVPAILPVPLGADPLNATLPSPASAPLSVMDVPEVADRSPATVPWPRSSAPPLLTVRLPVCKVPSASALASVICVVPPVRLTAPMKSLSEVSVIALVPALKVDVPLTV